MDAIEYVRRLREEYEQALDEAEQKRSAYHQTVRKLYMSGMPLREIADQLGISHQRVHQIVGEEPPARRKRRRAAGAAGVAIVLLAGGLSWFLFATRTPRSRAYGGIGIVCAPVLDASGPPNERLVVIRVEGTGVSRIEGIDVVSISVAPPVKEVPTAVPPATRQYAPGGRLLPLPGAPCSDFVRLETRRT